MQALLCVDLPVSYVTIGAAVILLIGAIIGGKRGLLKSVFSIVCSIGSIIAATFITPYVGNFLLKQSFVESMGSLGPQIVNILSFVIAWILAFLVLKLIFALINRIFSGDGILGGLNRFFGVLFGIASAFLTVIVLAYLINIFSGTSFGQTIVTNAKIDPVGNWLLNNNLLDTILNWLGQKIPAIQQFLDSVSAAIPAVPAA